MKFPLETFMQELSYNLDGVRFKEQLLKAVLLYSFDQDQAPPTTSLCHLAVREQLAQCQLCPSAQHDASFRVQAVRGSRTRWVEVDVTSFLLPLVQSYEKNIHLLINLTCSGDEARTRGEKAVRRWAAKLTIRSPSLLLYFNNTSELAYQRPPVASRPGSPVGVNSLEEGLNFEPELRGGHHKRRRRRSSPKRKWPLPELKSVYDFPTTDCDLYDYRVSFSQLKLNHWIIYPHWYNPGYCKGVCPRTLGHIYGSRVHTFVQNIIYERLDSSMPRPSCVPLEYKPMSVLTERNGIISFEQWDDMIATRCTCR